MASGALGAESAGRVRVEKRGGVGWIVLDHPARRNAISVSMWRELEQAATELGRDAAIRCVVVRGAGELAFVSGADISEFGQVRSGADAERGYGEVSGRAMAALALMEVPVLAMIRGFCVGGGVALSLGCDCRYAADDAVFAIPAARLGLGYSLAGIEALIAVVGPAHAKEMFFSARRYGAAEAAAMGLVNRVYPAAELEDAVGGIASAIASNAPLTLRAVKRAAREALRTGGARDTAAVQAAIDACFESRDYQEGVRAFLEKRPPRFEGR
jgi:enoyl-CoA hydratase/carnithine racemase